MRTITKITINGVDYDGPDAMPKEVREQYERALAALKGEDGDGVPDILQGVIKAKVVVKQKIVVNGKEYASRDESPDDVRRLLERVGETVRVFPCRGTLPPPRLPRR